MKQTKQWKYQLFKFFRLYKWYQTVQRITNMNFENITSEKLLEVKVDNKLNFN